MATADDGNGHAEDVVMVSNVGGSAFEADRDTYTYAYARTNKLVEPKNWLSGGQDGTPS